MNELVHPLTIVGGSLFCLGGLPVFVLFYRHGVLGRSLQIDRFGELWRGERGRGAQRGLRAGLFGVGLGAVLSFSGVAAMDAKRAQRCRDHCAQEGFAKGRIGPNSDRTEDRSTWWVACICTAPDRTPAEVRARDLVPSRQP